MDETIQEASSMTTAQSFIGVASSSNIKCSFCLCEECEQQHDYFIIRVKELTDIFKEMTYNINVHTSKKISQPLKCRRLKKSISQSLSIISERNKSMTTAPSHSNPKGKEKEEEQEKEEEKEKEKEKEEKEKKQEKEEEEKKKKKKKQEKEKEKEKVKKKAKEKEKKVKVVSCDVKQQYPFEGFNIDGKGPTELMSSFSQWINEGLYKHHAKKRDKDDHYLANCSDLEFKQLDFVFAFPKKKDWFYYMDVILYYLLKKSKQQSHSKYRYITTNCFFKTYIDNASVIPEYENKIVGTIKGFDEVYVPVNCNGEFHWVLAVVVLKERCIKVYDSMSSSRTNRKLCAEIQKLSTMLPNYLESSEFYEQKDQTNWSVLESYQGKNKSHPFEVYMLLVLPNKQAIVYKYSIRLFFKSYHYRNVMLILGLLYFLIDDIPCSDCEVFVAAYAEFLSDGLQIPSDGIISQSLCLRYASLLWNYGILKARSGYVNTNIMAPVKRKIVLTKETTNTKIQIQKGHRTRTCRKKNENSTTTLLEELASEAVSSSQVEAEFSQKEYEERERKKCSR
ncbi:hypothetical protein H5410_051653 [Solanum commersonii]|uniref:Ubiquitin-like protease family profile domain-containing protein n=1 Tax=Solanum commersonii TaxID=4109 RepID=A0A9J5WZ32_SOLCO|nr:hypothetical protein H5410_051653 [Solanum commersonii]